jgi:hypothetical protein
MYRQVVRYYWKMQRENGEFAMSHTLEMFEGLNEKFVEHLIATHDMDGNELVTR